MKPLSSINYIRNNRKKSLTIGLSICLGVFLVYFLSMIIEQFNYSTDAVCLKPLSYSSIVFPVKGEIPKNIIINIKKNKNIQRIIPICSNGCTNITTILGANSVNVYFLKNKNIDFMMKKMKLKLIRGRKPKNENEIILHKDVMANRNLHIGSIIGTKVDSGDYLRGKYKITGIIDGQCIVGFSGCTYKPILKYGFIIVAKQNQINNINDYLESLSSSKVDIYSLKEEMYSLAPRMKMINSTVILLELLVTIVLCISLGNISYMNFHNRKREFGVLYAIGISKRKLYKKIFSETLIIGIIGYICGIALSLACGYMLNLVLWSPKGQTMPLWNIKNVLIVIFVPLFVIISSSLPVANLLKKLDSIAVIEGE